jgi:hypothetical protein
MEGFQNCLPAGHDSIQTSVFDQKAHTIQGLLETLNKTDGVEAWWMCGAGWALGIGRCWEFWGVQVSPSHLRSQILQGSAVSQKTKQKKNLQARIRSARATKHGGRC